MDTFAQLRKKARDIRDQAIATANVEYTASLGRIAALERDLAGQFKSRNKRMSFSVDSVIPKDRPFTTADLLGALEALDDGRVWRRARLLNHLGRLLKRGIIRRVQKNHGRNGTVYAVTDLEVAPLPINKQTLPLAVEAVLKEHGGALRPAEIVVRLRERGFRETMSHEMLRKSVSACCRAGTEKFRAAGNGKWAVV